MSIAYAEPDLLQSDPEPSIFGSLPAGKFAASAILVLATVGTTSGVPLTVPTVQAARPFTEGQALTTNPALPVSEAELVKWIKDQSGLTWDQIARAFDVSRRAVHLWANGGRVSAGNAEAIQSFTALVRGTNAATPEEARSLLLSVGSDGMSPLDRFRRYQYEASVTVTGTPLTPAALLGDSSDAAQ
jgi:DNA-binding transcriptional regulator YiaG